MDDRNTMTNDVFDIVNNIVNDNSQILAYVQNLASESRVDRQKSAAVIEAVASRDANLLTDYIDNIVAALDCREPQTRWDCFDALCYIVPLESRLCDKAIVPAEASLFDEKSGAVRLAAFRFLCTIGATTARRSLKVWPLLDEALQCYHGDSEYAELLQALSSFAEGKIDKEVVEEIVKRLSFDAENFSSNMINNRSRTIVANLVK